MPALTVVSLEGLTAEVGALNVVFAECPLPDKQGVRRLLRCGFLHGRRHEADEVGGRGTVVRVGRMQAECHRVFALLCPLF